ncbi:MAG: hypothetical protein J1F32_04815 [Erysipelotrichales bacterium]|nr:hypothetical protein [Erysipelotrichales bacterium]
MNEEFNKFKSKVLKEHLIKCIIMGVSLSAIVIALLAIIFKRIPLHVHFLIYILLSIVLAAGLTFMLYKLLMPTDEKIAKRLDKTFALKEKVQTMVVNKDKTRYNPILKMQKEDAEKSLSEISPKSLPFKLSYIYYVFAIIAILFVATSCVVPAAPAKDKPGPGSFPGSDDVPASVIPGSGDLTSGSGDGIGDQIEDIYDLIDRSDAEDKVKEGIKDVLHQLEEALQNASSKEEMENAIKDAINKIDKIVDDANSKEEIGVCLTQETNSNLVDLGYALIDGDIDGIKSALDNLESEFINLNGKDLIDDLKDVAFQIEDALINSGVDEDDELYVAFKHLLDSLNEIAESLERGSLSENNAKDAIHEAIEKAKDEIIQDVILQKNNQELGDLVKMFLEQLLEELENTEPGEDDGDGDGEQKEDDGDDKKDDPDNPDDGDEENPDNPDVPGDGETIYGSNDTIYSDNGHSEYGDVLDDYYDKVVDEESKGDTPDDIGDILGDYFGSLYH